MLNKELLLRRNSLVTYPPPLDGNQCVPFGNYFRNPY